MFSFTVGAFIAVALIGWLVGRANDRDREKEYDRLDDEAVRRSLLLHIRQDLKLIAFALMAILVMLGIIADRLPTH